MSLCLEQWLGNHFSSFDESKELPSRTVQDKSSRGLVEKEHEERILVHISRVQAGTLYRYGFSTLYPALNRLADMTEHITFPQLR